VAAAPEKSRFVFAYTNDDVARLNTELRDVMRRRGELGTDHKLPTADGKQSFAAGDRIQIVATDKARRLYNGTVGTVQEIQGTKLTVEFDGRKARPIEFDANEFQKFRHGYAGTIYKGQGRTLDETYLYHSEHWRSAASYVALTRHRDATHLFVARNTAADLTQLARQMARVDDRRAASQFHHTYELGLTQPLTPREVVARFNQTLANRSEEVPRPRSAAGDAQTREQRAISLAEGVQQRAEYQQQRGASRDPSPER
jgi:ATP-dependent exoDNAse (exonuclease V) alpha subunit